jgi:hypothetical protein
MIICGTYCHVFVQLANSTLAMFQSALSSSVNYASTGGLNLSSSFSLDIFHWSWENCSEYTDSVQRAITQNVYPLNRSDIGDCYRIPGSAVVVLSISLPLSQLATATTFLNSQDALRAYLPVGLSLAFLGSNVTQASPQIDYPKQTTDKLFVSVSSIATMMLYGQVPSKRVMTAQTDSMTLSSQLLTPSALSSGQLSSSVSSAAVSFGSASLSSPAAQLTVTMMETSDLFNTNSQNYSSSNSSSLVKGQDGTCFLQIMFILSFSLYLCIYLSFHLSI